MGRRKKEPEDVHRERIAAAAERLFSHGGIEAATMDQIAGEAGYSKATLYVYFENKEALVDFLVLKSMRLLHRRLAEAVAGADPVRVRYDRICAALVDYQEQSPLYFSLALGEIDVDPGRGDLPPVRRETYEVGERLNGVLTAFLRAGIDAGEFSPEIPLLPTVFLFWAALSGLIRMVAQKRAYLEQATGLSKQQFLDLGFERLYRMIALGGEG